MMQTLAQAREGMTYEEELQEYYGNASEDDIIQFNRYYRLLQLELFIFTSQTCVAAAFLLARALTPYPSYTKYLLMAHSPHVDCSMLWCSDRRVKPLDVSTEVKNKISNAEEADFMSRNIEALAMFGPLTVYPLISFFDFFLIRRAIRVLNWHYDITDERYMLHYLAITQAILAFVLYFLPFYSLRFGCWNKIAPIFHFIIVHFVFLVAPIAAIYLGSQIFNP